MRINLTFRKIIDKAHKRKNPEVLEEYCKKVKSDEHKGIFKESRIPDDVFSIGDDVFVSANIFQGNVMVHIRRYKKFGETYYPTKEGVTLQPWWIPYIMNRTDIPQIASDLQGSVCLPEDQIKIFSTDFVNFTFTRITIFKSTETVSRSLTITDSQCRKNVNRV